MWRVDRSISNVEPVSVAAGLSALVIAGAASQPVSVVVGVVVLLAGAAVFEYGRSASRSLPINRRAGTPTGPLHGRFSFELEPRQRADRLNSVRYRSIGGRPEREWIARATPSSDRNRRNRHDADRARDDEPDARPDPVRSPSELTRAAARKILDVGVTADDTEIKAAYRRRIKDVHPDNGGDRVEFLRVKAAYERLVG